MNLSISKLEEILTKREQLFQQIPNAREALCICSEKLKELKEVRTDDKATRKLTNLKMIVKNLGHFLQYDIFRTKLDN